MPIVLENAPQPEPLSVNRMLAHDARNVLASLQLYSELLALPGVLAAGREHYARDLGAVVEAGLRMIEKLAAAAEAGKPAPSAGTRADGGEGSGGRLKAGIVTNETYPTTNFNELLADAGEAGCLECH